MLDFNTLNRRRIASNIDLLPAILPDRSIEIEPDPSPPTPDSPYVVILYNCDCHSFEDVEIQLQKATGCTIDQAEAFAMEVHTTGRAIVFGGTIDECDRVANVLREIRLQVETNRA